MQFTLISMCAAAIMTIAGVNPAFIPAFLIVGYAIDHNRRSAH